MTVLINLIGQPSCGKSTAAAKLFARMKDMGLNCEYTQEYVKGWVWDGRKISPYDQFTIFGREAYNQSHLFNKVDFIISDSPVMLTAFYHLYYNKDNALREICKDFYEMAERIDHVHTFNFYLPRMKQYKQEGRYQTEEEANEVARMLKAWLEVEAYPFIPLDCPDEQRVDKILSYIGEYIGGNK